MEKFEELLVHIQFYRPMKEWELHPASLTAEELKMLIELQSRQIQGSIDGLQQDIYDEEYEDAVFWLNDLKNEMGNMTKLTDLIEKTNEIER